MDYDLTRRFAIRVFQVDYIHTTLFSETQNNYRFSTGLVYRWGALQKEGAPIAYGHAIVLEVRGFIRTRVLLRADSFRGPCESRNGTARCRAAPRRCFANSA